jgi:hypothetical protein
MLKATVVQIWKQPIGIKVTQSPNVVITTTRVEMVVTPCNNVVKGGILIGSAINLGCGKQNFDRKEFESEFRTTNSKYCNCWDTLDGVY